MKRREVIKSLSVLPVAGVVMGSSFPFESVIAAPATSPAPKRDFFKELGLRTFINAAGTYTAMTGSLMPDEVVEAIGSTSQRNLFFWMMYRIKQGKKLQLCAMQKQLP